MIWMTPALASVPYSVAAAGPLMISMLSMSPGSMSFNRERFLGALASGVTTPEKN